MKIAGEVKKAKNKIILRLVGPFTPRWFNGTTPDEHVLEITCKELLEFSYKPSSIEYVENDSKFENGPMIQQKIEYALKNDIVLPTNNLKFTCASIVIKVLNAMGANSSSIDKITKRNTYKKIYNLIYANLT